MVSSKRLQQQYNKLYAELRNYIWPFPTVELIAKLEMATYRALPNTSEIRDYLSRLRYDVANELRDDDELREEFESFEKMAQDDSTYLKLPQNHEVIQQ